ncbi:hypothetical protein NBT05_08460 [Aquimarina sp. ERC-38]|uniref:hypothetical protein n=1 Tax=Aquimarina sp. ERC-38 TaxID=2949996 RepID=UPI002245CBC2|nr:hypothetical protein [Aquimarina sp. ERC-38]UZO82494.1 hypothetical protein NBT05_08460 [Aquimarina sp. ERC-38]
MAPLKFEEEMKEKFEARTIQPSENSWDQLESLLDKNQNKKVNNKFSYILKIAAACIGLIFIVSIYLLNNQKDKSINTIVDSNDAPKHNFIEDTLKNTNNKNEYLRSTQQYQLTEHKGSIDSVKERKVMEQPVVANTSNNIVDHKKIQKAVLTETTKISLERMDSININSKVRQLALTVASLENNNTVVSDQEIDSLLRQAQNEILQEKIKNADTVDASMLLASVEAELDESFKQKVFDALKSGYKKIRTAVAQRNN